MAEQVRKQKPVQDKKTTEEQVDAVVDAEAEKLKAETEDLLDEIDGLLEENAEEFVRNYVQKGGQAVRVFLNRVREGFIATSPASVFKMRFLP